MTAKVATAVRTPLVTVTVWTKGYVYAGQVVPLTFSLSFRWNAASDATFTVASDDRTVAALRASGARAVVSYYADQDDATPTLSMSGTVWEQSGKPRTGRVTPASFTVEDDWVDIMQDTLGWPAPAQPITNQGAESAYFKASGPAETVARSIILANAVTRAGKPLTVPTSLGRGTSITVTIRMHPLVDRLFPAVDDAGVGLQILQVDDVRHLVVSVRDTYPEVLTDATGEVIDCSYRISPPTVTRLVCGASGKQEARVFRLKVDTARETEWGFKREEFLDVRDLKYPSSSFEDDVTAKAAERFAETAATSGVDAQLQESARMWVGREIKLGTNVQVQIGDGAVVEDVVREIRVTSSRAGLQVTPLVGMWDESGDQGLYRLIADGSKKTRDLGVE